MTNKKTRIDDILIQHMNSNSKTHARINIYIGSIIYISNVHLSLIKLGIQHRCYQLNDLDIACDFNSNENQKKYATSLEMEPRTLTFLSPMYYVINISVVY